MLRIIPALLMAAACGGASAQGLYKCTLDGKVTYSVDPCKAGTMKAIAVPPAPPRDPGRGDALKRERSTLDELQKARAEREAQDERAQLQDAESERAKRCAALRLEHQQAVEHAAGAPGFNKANRRAQAERKGEAVAAECGT